VDAGALLGGDKPSDRRAKRRQAAAWRSEAALIMDEAAREQHASADIERVARGHAGRNVRRYKVQRQRAQVIVARLWRGYSVRRTNNANARHVLTKSMLS